MLTILVNPLSKPVDPVIKIQSYKALHFFVHFLKNQQRVF